jgi:outer membrane lipase/esterase
VLAASAAQAQTYERVVAFGDSLPDSGNLFRATNQTQPPSPPYFQGRFSNGPTYIELLGFQPLQLFGAVNGNVNNAFGGARTDLQTSPPSLQVQLNGYLAAGGRFGPNDLAIVYGGANNILQGVPGAAVSPNPTAVLGGISTAAANDILGIATRIAGAGAGTVVVPNLPGFGDLPPFRNGPASALVEFFGSGAFNARLAAGLPGVAQANPNSNIILVDVERAVAQIRSSPAAFGFTNVTTPCLNAQAGTVCATPDTFFYWDDIHPTARLHQMFAAVVSDYIYYGRRGAATATQAEASIDHRESAMDAALDRVRSIDERGPRLHIALDVAEATEDARGDIPESERSTVSMRFGFAGLVSPNTAAGVSFSGARSDVEAGALTFEANSIGADAYVSWRSGGAMFVDAVFGGSIDEYDDIRRFTGVGALAHSADRTEGSTVGAKVQTGWRVETGGGAVFTPRAALYGVRAEVDPYNEQGFSARHAVRAREVEAVGAEAAIRLDTRLAGFDAHLEAGYGDYLSYDGDVATALVDNPAKPIAVSVDAPGRGLLLNAGLEGEVFGGWSLGAAYRGRLDESSDSHAAVLSLTLRH